MKVKITSIDKLFSEYIRKRANGKCERCGTYQGWKKLQCAHFHSRRKKSVRWHEDNAVALCAGCHIHLDGNPLEKVEFFQSHLGETKFNMLNIQAEITTKSSPLDMGLIQLYFKEKIKELEIYNPVGSAEL